MSSHRCQCFRRFRRCHSYRLFNVIGKEINEAMKALSSRKANKMIILSKPSVDSNAGDRDAGGFGKITINTFLYWNDRSHLANGITCTFRLGVSIVLSSEYVIISALFKP